MSVHPPLAHVAIGGLVTAAILDVLSLLARAPAIGLYTAAGYALMIGTGALILAVPAGFVDRARRTAPSSQQRSDASRHALFGLATGMVAVTDLVLRREVFLHPTQVPLVVVVLTVVLAVLVGFTGHLGGRLVFHAGVGVAARATIAPTTGELESS